MEQPIRPSNQSGSQTQSQTPAQPINRWQPITDIYQQEAEVFAPPPVSLPPKPVPVPVSQRDLPKSSVPISLNIITGLFFLRALVYFVLGRILSTHPDSGFSQWLVSMSGSMAHPAINNQYPDVIVRTAGYIMLAVAGLSLLVGILWLIRWWVIRWVTMCYAGGMVLRTGVYYFAGAASGVGSGLSVDQSAALLLGCAINLLIFCYLAFYPGVKEAFEKPL